MRPPDSPPRLGPVSSLRMQIFCREARVTQYTSLLLTSDHSFPWPLFWLALRYIVFIITSPSLWRVVDIVSVSPGRGDGCH